MSDISMLKAFYKDYFVIKNENGTYEFCSGGSVGGHMSALVFNYLEEKYKRDRLVKYGLLISEFDKEYLNNINMWGKNQFELRGEKIEEVVNLLLKELEDDK